MRNPIYLPPSAEKIQLALLGATEELDPMEELINSVEAVFLLLRHLNIHPELKEAFEPLRKQVLFYSNLVVLAASKD